MLSMLSMYDQNHNDQCFLCNNVLTEIKSYPNVCDHLFHYKCLRKYVDSRLDKSESIICPICSKIFNQIGNKYKKSKEILFQNVILSNDETQCCICFSKYKCPVASTDSCAHTFCFECLKKWCTFKHECPMDRMPIKLLLLSDFPGGHITKKEEPPQIEQDLNCDGDNDEILNTTCEICNLGNNDHQLLLCDNCNRGYHIYCLADPLSEIPEGDWFCEECSEYMGISNHRLPRGIRGLHQVIDNLESRIYDQENNRNQSSRHRPGRGRRNTTRANINTSSDDSDYSDQVLRARTITRRSNGGVVRRSRRNRVIHSDEEESVADERQDEILPSTGSNNELSGNERIVEESEEEQETELEGSEGLINRAVSITHSEASSSGKETTVRRRHRQGSLSSEAESELEPSRKKIKPNGSSSESCSISTDDESVTSLQVTTRKRAKARVEDSEPNDEDDNPLPRPIKRPRRIDESSDESIDESRPKYKLRKIVESDSNDLSEEGELENSSDNEDEQEETEEKDDRKRNFSTSSSLSTIPCRAPSISMSDPQSSTNLPTIKPKRSRLCAKVEDIFSDSSAKDVISTDSDYDPFSDKTLQQPSTSRSSHNKKISVRKRKRSRKTQRRSKTSRKCKTTKKKKKSKHKTTTSTRRSTRKSQASSSNLENNSFSLTTTLSLFGREKQLPVVSDEEMKIKIQVSRANPTVSNNTSRQQHNSTNTNILSEINEAQSNFRQISLATVTRLSDGTLIHKTREIEPISSNENKDPKNISHSVPSTSSQLPFHSAPVSTSSSSSSSVTHAVALQQLKPPIQQVQPIIQKHSRPAAVTPAQPISTNSSNSIPDNTNSAKSPTASANTHITDISVTIKKFLNKFLEKGKITADESKSLTDRIKEKIMKRNNQRKTPGESSIKEFSKKYLEFYLKKRK